MIFEKFKTLDNDRMIKATIGMSRVKFDQLAKDFTSAFQEHQANQLEAV